MRQEIKIPQMGESVSEASIGIILKPTGSIVKENEEIVELETEKVNQLLYAPCAGVITWSVQTGDPVPIGTTIGVIDSAGTPTAVAKEELQPKKEVPPPQPEPPLKVTGQLARKKMSRIRQTIANRLVESLHTAAMLTTFNEVDMSTIIALREQHKESFVQKHGVKLGFMSFFVYAVTEALKHYPDFNSYIEQDEIVIRQTYDIGIAVGTEKGLVVPVVRNCDKLSFAQIEKEIASYAQKARSNTLSIGDLEGGGFTITNGGVYGSLLSTPILNPPQVGILGMHKIMKRAVVVEDAIVIRPMMYLALSYDHRLIDGKEAVSFLVHIKETLERLVSL
jgi:2-oxoglutarate dehydrogenase E2 component (dihydrolipoamide succinyltransferase)